MKIKTCPEFACPELVEGSKAFLFYIEVFIFIESFP